MTTKKLSDLDFMMMDVHRPMLDEEINEVNPQAIVDKSAGPFQVIDGDAKSVGAPYPHELPLPPNIELLDNYTKLDLTSEEILRNAYDAGMVELVVVGIDGDGVERVFRTNSALPRAMFWLFRGQHILNSKYDNMRDGVEDDDERA